MDENDFSMNENKPVNDYSSAERNDTIKIKVPPITKKIRQNPWIAVSVILILIIVFLVYKGGITGGIITGGAISQSTASNNLLTFLNSQAPGEFILVKTTKENGLYRMDVDYQGQVVPIYVTIDGKLAGSMQPLVLDVNGTKDGAGTVVDVSEDDDPVEGSPDAPVTIVEFSDYECPFCGKFYTETYGQLKKDYIDTGKVKLVFRDFPLSFHPTAMPAALAAQCVYDASGNDNDVYFEYHNKLFENQQSLTDENLKKWASDLGYDISDCLDNKEFESEVNKDLADGQAYGVSGTPAFFVNGELIEGAVPYANFKQVIDAQLAAVGSA